MQKEDGMHKVTGGKNIARFRTIAAIMHVLNHSLSQIN
jgi:hypothetical protein